MKFAVSIALVVGGLVLLGFGIEEADSLQSQVVEVFTGEPTEEALGLLISGAVALGLGLVGLAASFYRKAR